MHVKLNEVEGGRKEEYLWYHKSMLFWTIRAVYLR